MAQDTKKTGPVVRDMSAARKYVRNLQMFCTPMVKFMDGGEGRRVFTDIRTSDPRYKPSEGYTLYTVYSYRWGWPLYVYDEQARQWFGNREKASQTTSKHSNQLMPCSPSAITWVSCADLLGISQHGVAYIIKHKLEGEYL